jgi:hypothetical protein
MQFLSECKTSLQHSNAMNPNKGYRFWSRLNAPLSHLSNSKSGSFSIFSVTKRQRCPYRVIRCWLDSSLTMGWPDRAEMRRSQIHTRRPAPPCSCGDGAKTASQLQLFAKPLRWGNRFSASHGDTPLRHPTMEGPHGCVSLKRDGAEIAISAPHAALWHSASTGNNIYSAHISALHGLLQRGKQHSSAHRKRRRSALFRRLLSPQNFQAGFWRD